MAEKGFLRRGRVSPRRRRAASVLRAVGAIALAAAIAAGAARIVSGSLLRLERFEVSGNLRERTEEILAALAPYRTKSLLTLDLTSVADRLTSLPWVERVTVTA